MHVFIESLLQKTHLPVGLTVLTPEIGESLGVTDRESSNAFGKLRFLIPWMCNFEGHAIWLDGADMLMRCSLAELWAHRSGWHGVSVVPHEYETKHPVKYVGTKMESPNVDYPAKNQSSVMLWNNSFFPHRKLTPEFVSSQPGQYLHRFEWMPDKERIGELPAEFNHIPGECEPNPEAKIVHFSLGIPGFEHYRHEEHAREWQDTLKRAATGIQYLGR